MGKENNKEVKICKLCGEEKPTDEILVRNGNCRVCNYFENRKDVKIRNGWTLEEYKIVLHNLLNKKVEYVNELELILNRNIDEIAVMVKELKINGGGYRVQILYTCKKCKTKFPMNIHKYFEAENRFCSESCRSEWWSETFSGENNPTFCSIKVNCDWCKKEILVTPFDMKRSKNHFCSRDCTNEWFRNVYVKTDEFIIRNREVALTNLKNGVFKTDSAIQLKINDLLNNLNIKFKNEHVVGKYSFDNYLLKENLFIEVMGSFWHADPRIYKTINYDNQRTRIFNDKTKNTYIKNKYNKNILYLWEEDINTDIELCEKLIMVYLNNDLSDFHSFNYHLDKNKNIKAKMILIKPYAEYSNNDLDKITDLSVKYKPNYYITFNCDNCGKEDRKLIKNYEKQKNHFCSKKCHLEFQKTTSEEKRIKTDCQECGKQLSLMPCDYNSSKNHFCSKECFDKWQTVSTKSTCDNCGEDILVPPRKLKTNKHFFCSHKCSVDYRRKNKSEYINVKYVKCNCDYCGKERNLTEKLYNRSKRHFCDINCKQKFESKNKKIK